MGEWIQTTCVCGTAPDERDVVLSEKDGRRTVRCDRCDQIRTELRPSDYETLYTEGRRYHWEEQDRIGREHYDTRFAHDLRVAKLRIPKLLGMLRSLDVGCANGAFVEEMKNFGFDAEGLEPNAGMVDVARRCAVLAQRFHTTWDTVEPGLSVITYHDVFEHVVDPRAELQRLRRYLLPGGLLVIDVPDADECFGPEARAAHHVKPDQHLWYFTSHTLVRLLAQYGFLVVGIDRPITGKLVVYARKN